MRSAPSPVTPARRSLPLAVGTALAFLTCGAARGAMAQGAIDPNVAPRAAALEREGERSTAIDLLGHYLATAPDDGRAWLQLGRFYLFDSRDWHVHGHRGDPDGTLYLDFAATAFDQAIRLSVDSGIVFRGVTEVDRALVSIEQTGWDAGGYARSGADVPVMLPYIVELGANLLASCPSGGVLLTGSDLEAVSVWYGSQQQFSLDVIPIRPDLYTTDSLYRRRMATAMRVDPRLPVQRALAAAAATRTVCLSPGADAAAAPAIAWTPFRLVRVSRPVPPGADALTITELLKASRQERSSWIRDVRGVYLAAARYNALLCSSLLLYLGDTLPVECRQ